MAKGESKGIKKWLWGYRDAKRECERMEQEYKQMLETQESPTAIRYDAMPISHGGNIDLSTMMVERAIFWERLVTASEEATKSLVQRSEAIGELSSSIQRKVLSMRYLQLEGSTPMAWDEIAHRMGYSVQWVYAIHGRALEALYAVRGSAGSKN